MREHQERPNIRTGMGVCSLRLHGCALTGEQSLGGACKTWASAVYLYLWLCANRFKSQLHAKAHSIATESHTAVQPTKATHLKRRQLFAYIAGHIAHGEGCTPAERNLPYYGVSNAHRVSWQPVWGPAVCEGPAFQMAPTLHRHGPKVAQTLSVHANHSEGNVCLLRAHHRGVPAWSRPTDTFATIHWTL